MRSKPDTNHKSNRKNSENNLSLKGIDLFKNKVEKYFFANAHIQVLEDSRNTDLSISILLNCNFGLTESLFHLNSGNWGGFCKNNTQLEYSGFELAVAELKKSNIKNVIIEEIVMSFKDTSLVITKIPDQDITDELCAILGALSENFVHFTKGLTEMPYEIFIPVFEEANVENNETNSNASWALSKIRSSYFNYWGLYFNSEIDQDSSIYDLKAKTIIDGDFYLLNKE